MQGDVETARHTKRHGRMLEMLLTQRGYIMKTKNSLWIAIIACFVLAFPSISGATPQLQIVTGDSDIVMGSPGEDIHYSGQEIIIDLYVIVEYGTRITAVANSVANNVRYQVENTIGVPVKSVNVHVRGLRISNID